MEFIENLLNHMSSTFNRESVLPKESEISEDETFKWRALKNNQFAKSKRINKDTTAKISAEDTPGNTGIFKRVENSEASSIVIEIASDISGVEIQEIITASNIGISNFQQDKHQENNDKPVMEQNEHTESVHPKQTVSTNNIFEHMSSTFNARAENCFTNTASLPQCDTVETSNEEINRRVSCDSNTTQTDTASNTNHPKIITRTVRRSNRLKYDCRKIGVANDNEQNMTCSTKNQHPGAKSEVYQSNIDTRSAAGIKFDAVETKNTETEGSSITAIQSSADPIRNIQFKRHFPCQKTRKMRLQSIAKKHITISSNDIGVASNKINVKPKKQSMLRSKLSPNFLKNYLHIDGYIKKSHDGEKISSSAGKSVESTSNVSDSYSITNSVFHLRGRLSRPIKLSAKILANKELRHGFELQNNARLECNMKNQSPEETTVQPVLNHLTSTTQLEPDAKIENKLCSDVKRFLREIKRLHLVNNQSPENDRSLSKSQYHQLLKFKEKHFRMLGLSSVSENIQANRELNEGTEKACKAHVVYHVDKCSDEGQAFFERKCMLPMVYPTRDTGKEASPEKKNVYSESRKFALNAKCLNVCLCKNHFTYFTTLRPASRMYCTAIDDVDGRFVKCGNKLERKAQNLLRPSITSSFQLLCQVHHRRFRRHGSCASCGIYCTQGKFAICYKRHLFHLKCAEKYVTSSNKNILKCPHCGLEGKSCNLETKVQRVIN